MTIENFEIQRPAAIVGRFREAVGHPLSAMIEISDRCNEVCAHCYQEQGTKGEMDTGEVCALLDQLAERGILFLTVSGGEPTLRKDFLQIIEHAYKCKFVIRLFTNGLTMTRELAEAMYRNAVSAVEISVYSPKPEIHDFVTGVPESFERTIQGVRNLVAAGVMVLMKTPVMSLNERDLDSYRQFATDLGAYFALDINALHAREGGGRSASAFDRSEEVRLRLLREYKPVIQAAGLERPLRAPRHKAPCGAGQGVHVEPNGELRPCTLLEVSLGNVREQSIADARADSANLKSIQELTWAHLHGCRTCDMGSHCNRCYADALAQTGDALGPYPSACRAALGFYEERNGVSLQMCEDDSAITGPFQFLSNGKCVRVPDERTPEDEALAVRVGWVRRDRVAGRPVRSGGRPGELVQLRRPGRTKAIQQRIPTGVQAERVAKHESGSWATTGGNE